MVVIETFILEVDILDAHWAIQMELWDDSWTYKPGIKAGDKHVEVIIHLVPKHNGVNNDHFTLFTDSMDQY